MAKNNEKSQKMFEIQTKDCNFVVDLETPLEDSVRTAFLKSINKCTWNWAKTMRGVPHEYIVRGKCAMSESEFKAIFDAQREKGHYENWGKYHFPYLYLDGYKYWTMGSPWEETIILNRQKIFNEYDLIAEQYDSLRSSDECMLQNAQIGYILSQIVGSVYEIGVGTGLSLSIADWSKNRYYGIDPSRQMLVKFREKFPKVRGVKRTSFEEVIDDYKAYENVVALFGSASYIMPQYLQELGKIHRGLFLMFYKHDVVPQIYVEAGKSMHQFNYMPGTIKNMFPDCAFINYDDYYIVTTLQIDWNEAMKANPKPKPPKQATLF